MFTKPTVGRIVWYYIQGSYSSGNVPPLAAIIAKVNSDSDVNLAVFDPFGTSRPAVGVEFLQDVEDGIKLVEGAKMAIKTFATWMPYQKAQAEKNAASEEQERQRNKPIPD